MYSSLEVTLPCSKTDFKNSNVVNSPRCGTFLK